MIFYHGTAESQVEYIEARGLVPGGGKGGDAYLAQDPVGQIVEESLNAREGREFSPLLALGRGVFLTRNKEWAGFFANLSARVNFSRPAVLKVDLPQTVVERLKQDEYDDQGFRYEGVIAPEWIKGQV